MNRKAPPPVTKITTWGWKKGKVSVFLPPKPPHDPKIVAVYSHDL